MAEDNVLSLGEFAEQKSTKRANQCFLCSIPEREEVERGRTNGVSIPLVQAWLEQERGYDRSQLHEERLRKHFRAGHHLKDTQ